MKIDIGNSKLIYCVPKSDVNDKWGVYSIPRMWRDLNGKIVIRFNGEMDCGDTDNMNIAPNLFFESCDNGCNWNFVNDGDNVYPIDILNGITSSYTKVGRFTLAFREKKNLDIIKNTPYQKEFLHPNGEAFVKSYRYGDIADSAKGVERILYDENLNIVDITSVDFDFPEREILVNTKGENEGVYVDVEERVKQSIFKNNYFCSVTKLDDDTLVALCCGQNPDVNDHYNGVAYLIESNDMGLTWKKRSTVAEDVTLPYGYTGDSHEVSLCYTKGGTLMCAMRMDMSINPDVEQPICDTMIAISKDKGYTWEKPFSVSDSSVTPQIVSLDNGVVVIVYGRPGVHFKYSVDEGATWSESYSIIGKTLSENRQEGIRDALCKYFDTVSYSNVFVEKVSDDSIVVLYTDLKYNPGDGLNHKAGFVKKITFNN